MNAYSKIELMNNLIGNKTPLPNEEDFWDAISNQTSLVTEEAKELQEEVDTQDLEKTLKELSDVIVVAFGLYQKFQKAGVDVDVALNRVCDNNLEKFHRDSEHAKETVQYYMDQDIETYVRTVNTGNGEYYAVINKETNKLLKPHDFTKVDLSDLARIAYERAE